MPNYQANRFSALHVKTITKPGLHCDGANLYLQVGPTGSKSWIFRYRPEGGRTREMGLGPVRDVSLALAREKALKLRIQLLDGIDPLAEKEKKRAARQATIKVPTLEQCFREYVIAYGKQWRPRTKDNIVQSVENHILPTLGKMKVSQVEIKHVADVMRPIWNRRTALTILGRLRNTLEWAKHQGWRDGENPAEYNVLKFKLPAREVKEERHRASLPWREVPALVAALRQQDSAAAYAAEFVVLSALRAEEVAGMEWTEINWDGQLLLIPARRMKGKAEHMVPLTGRMIEILETMKTVAQNEYVFPSPKYPNQSITGPSLLNNIKGLCGWDANGQAKATTHGFRTTIYGWVDDETEYPGELVDVQLAHKVKDEVKAAYKRASMINKRRAFLEHWSRVCGGEEPIDNVVDIRAART